MNYYARQVYDLLYVENHSYGLDLIRSVVKDRNRRVRFNHVATSTDAIAYLQRTGKYVDAPIADLTILDLSTDQDQCQEYLGLRLGNPIWRVLPILVFVKDEDTLATCYNVGVNAYICKPAALDELAALMVAIERFWFKFATLRHRNRAFARCSW